MSENLAFDIYDPHDENYQYFSEHSTPKKSRHDYFEVCHFQNNQQLQEWLEEEDTWTKFRILYNLYIMKKLGIIQLFPPQNQFTILNIFIVAIPVAKEANAGPC
jgi:hypothetical protein